MRLLAPRRFKGLVSLRIFEFGTGPESSAGGSRQHQISPDALELRHGTPPLSKWRDGRAAKESSSTSGYPVGA